MYFAIYALLNKAGEPTYVGSTNNPKRRMKEHKKSLGYKPEYVILEQGDEGRFVAEEKWIKRYQSMGYPLTNRAEFFGGRQRHCTSTRKLISARQKGRKCSPETLRRMSLGQMGVRRDWSPSGRERAEANQFKHGHRRHQGSSEARRRASLKAHWASLSDETKSKILRETNLKAWAARSPEERRRIGRKIADARARNLSPEYLSELGKKAGAALLAKHPNIGDIARARMKRWWANLSPRQRNDYLRRRTARLRIVWARKKKEREQKLAQNKSNDKPS
jgi:predicted GIY-YIG superfamily endonuclease